MNRADAMRLLAGSPFGRVVFTRDALPAVRTVNHQVDGDGNIIIRTRLTSRLTDTVRSEPAVVVAYQADDINPIERTGWSVVVTGMARPVADPERVAHYEKTLRPWIDGVADVVVAIEPTLVTGRRLVPQHTDAGPIAS